MLTVKDLRILRNGEERIESSGLQFRTSMYNKYKIIMALRTHHQSVTIHNFIYIIIG